MTSFDQTQQRVLQFDPTQHARVIGAPGTGKTHILVESYLNLSMRTDFRDDAIVVLTPGRQTATELRANIEQRARRVIKGTVAQTPASLAFNILQRQAALNGEQAPRLLPGALHDEVISHVVDDLRTGKFVPHHAPPFIDEVIVSRQYRDELREIDRLLNDYGYSPRNFQSLLLSETQSHNLTSAQRESWVSSAEVLHQVHLRMQQLFPGQFTTSQMFTNAKTALATDDRLSVPQIVLVDNAAEIGEGALGLLAQLAHRGASIWAFGDPDIATNAYQGERTSLLTGVVAELRRKGYQPMLSETLEQVCVLEHVHRHSSQLRALVRKVTENIGTAGLGQQRLAETSHQIAGEPLIQFLTTSHASEQVAVIAHRLRERHLGLGSTQTLPWSEMAIVCRTRAEVHRLSSQLAAQEVPTHVSAGGIVLGEHQIVRELIGLTRYAMGFSELTDQFFTEILTGVVCAIDAVSLKRLRRAVHNTVQQWPNHENVTSNAVNLPTELKSFNEKPTVDSVLRVHFMHPGTEPLCDMRAARQLRKLAVAIQTARQLHQDGSTAREVLWSIWESTQLAEKLQHQAIHDPQLKADDAHRMLDATMALFYALQREEEQGGLRPIAQIFEELLTSDVPQDTIATQSKRDAVTVATPQSLIGREFRLVCVTGVQEGVWPNLKPRGSMLASVALERFFRGDEATTPSRKETLHDELRLFAAAVSRATQELMVIAVADDDNHPSVLFGLGSEHHLTHRLPSNRLTLRGYVAQLRRRIAHNPEDTEAATSLAYLATLGIPGANPSEWYGVQPPSTDKPLVDSELNEKRQVFVSPSQIDTVETCPLNWFITQLGGAQPNAQAHIGTLMHYAFEHSNAHATAQELFEMVQSHWHEVTFEASWQEVRASNDLQEMAHAAAEYLKDFSRDAGELFLTEATFEVPIDFAVLRGTADRVELFTTGEGTNDEIRVADIKTGSVKPTAEELQQHAQLLSYQLAVVKNAFNAPGANGRAKLIFIHPKAVPQTLLKKGQQYLVLEQAAIDEHSIQQFEARVLDVARQVSAGHFTAQVEHHCTNPHTQAKACALHVIGTVNQP